MIGNIYIRAIVYWKTGLLKGIILKVVEDVNFIAKTWKFKYNFRLVRLEVNI